MVFLDQRRRDKRILFVLSLALLLAGVLIAGLGAAEGASVRPGARQAAATATLTVAQVGDISSFDPSQLPANDYSVLFQVFDTLVLESGSLVPKPRLAESWKVNPGKTAISITLRKNLHFSDGSPVTADDIVWNINRYKNPLTAANILPLASRVASAAATGPRSLVIHFVAPTPNIFDMLDLMFIVKPAPTATIKTAPIGTGPFKVDQWDPGNQIVLSRNPYYWQTTTSNITQVVIKDIPDPVSAGLMFASHGVDMVIQPSSTDFETLGQQPGAHGVRATVGGLILAVLANERDPIMSNLKVRQAISLAINRSAFVASYLPGGLSSPWCTPWRPGTPGYESAGALATNCKQNLTEAKQLLAQAGYAQGLSLTINTSTEAYAPGSGTMAQILQQDLAKIGVKLTINNLDPAAERLALVTNHNWQLAAHVYGRANRDPATLFDASVLFENGPTNVEGVSNSVYRRLVAGVTTTTNPATRSKQLKALNSYLIDQAFVTTVAPLPQTFLITDQVKGLAWNIDGMPLLGQVRTS